MIRCRVFNIATVLSLLLCAGNSIAWSYHHPYTVRFTSTIWTTPHDRRTVRHEIRANSGRWELEVETTDSRFEPDSDTRSEQQQFPPDLHMSSGPCDFGSIRRTDPSWIATIEFIPELLFSTGPDASACAPMRTIVVVTALLPLGILVRTVCRRRLKEGHCRACSYNLTANACGVCPECGTPVASRKGLVA